MNSVVVFIVILVFVFLGACVATFCYMVANEPYDDLPTEDGEVWHGGE